MAQTILEKEKYRWSYMTENQLVTRLKRITNPEKLRCFIQLAIDKDNRLLEHLATEKLYSLEEEKGGNVTFGPPVPVYSWQTETQGSVIVPLKKKRIKKVNTGSKKKKKAEDNIRTILI